MATRIYSTARMGLAIVAIAALGFILADQLITTIADLPQPAPVEMSAGVKG